MFPVRIKFSLLVVRILLPVAVHDITVTVFSRRKNHLRLPYAAFAHFSEHTLEVAIQAVEGRARGERGAADDLPAGIVDGRRRLEEQQRLGRRRTVIGLLGFIPLLASFVCGSGTPLEVLCVLPQSWWLLIWAALFGSFRSRLWANRLMAR